MAQLGWALAVWHLLVLFLCLAMLGLVRILRKQSPALRSQLLRASILGILALPIHGLLPQEGRVDAVPEVQAPAPVFLPELQWERLVVWRTFVQDTAPRSMEPSASKTAESFAGIWAGFAFLCVFLFLRGLIQIARGLRKSALVISQSTAPDGDDLEACRRIAEKTGIRAPRVLRSSAIRSPLVAGVLNPVLLLPVNLRVERAVWIHEMTHIRNGDVLWNLLASALACCFPLQPLFRPLRRTLAEAVEERCDDAVLNEGEDRQVYAGLLVDLTEKGGGMEVCSLPMARTSMLEKRLRRFLDASWIFPKKPTVRLRLMVLAAAFLGVAGAAWIFADICGIRNRTQAETKPVAESQTIVREFNFSVHPVTEYWKSRGFSQRLVALTVREDSEGVGYRILSNKIAAYLDSLPEKKVKVTVLLEAGKEPRLIQIGDLNLAQLAPEDIEHQILVRVIARVDRSVEGYPQPESRSSAGRAPAYDGTFALQVEPPSPPLFSSLAAGGETVTVSDSPVPRNPSGNGSSEKR